jgi:hypothetical protein
VEGEEAARPEVNVKVSLKKRGVTPSIVPDLIEHSWKHCDVEDKTVTISCYELCQVFLFLFFFFFKDFWFVGLSCSNSSRLEP